jgi:hypothetical protein
MYRTGIVIGAALFLASALEWILVATHYIELFEKSLPWLTQFTRPAGIWITMAVGVVLFLLAWNQRRTEGQHTSPSVPSVANTNTATGGNASGGNAHAAGGNATSTGGSATATVEVHQHNHLMFPPALIDELARELGERLRTGVNNAPLPGNQEPITPIAVGDGFIQLEEANLEVTANPLGVGDSITVRYKYANRGQLPVSAVQTWGTTVVAGIRQNSGDSLRNLMLDAARDGHRRFPNSGVTIGVQIEQYGLAPMQAQLTQDQMESIRNGSYALFFAVCGVWRDNSGSLHYWAASRIAEVPAFPDLAGFRWRNI